MSAAQVRNALYARTVNRISAALAIAPFALACLGAGVISTRVEFLCTLFYGAAFCCSIAYLIWATSAPFIVFARARRTTRRDPHGLARRAAMITLAASAVTLVLFLVLLMAAVGVTAFNAD
ncbi:MAG TPA: hypothetical protein VD971_06895 [Phycisphaerales bacterium]|nr:hypothetical protein [Phycisphaerales bacterium]